MGDQSLVYSVDEALSVIGFGNFQGLVLAYAGLNQVAEAMELMLLPFIGPAVQSEWDLSPTEKSIITTVVFAGMLIGAYLWGLVSDTYGRKKGFLGVMTVTTGAGLLSAFSPNYLCLVILRGLIGVGLGGGHVYASWFLEFLPTSNRGTWMGIYLSFGTIGTILEASLAWIVMPRLGWRWLLALSSAPSLMLLLLYGFTLESPRYLCMKGRTAEAHNVLKKVAVINQTELPPGLLVSSHSTNWQDEESAPSEETTLLSSVRAVHKDTKKELSSFSLLFSPELITTTLSLWFLFCANIFSYYGVVLLTSELSNGQNKCGSMALRSGNVQSNSLYVNTFITSLADIPGHALVAMTVDRVGRKLSMKVASALSFIMLLPLVSQQDQIWTTALLFGARVFIVANGAVANVYTPEVYSTSVRATGVGTAMAMGRIGGMVCPLVAVGLVSGCHQAAAVSLFEVVTVLLGVCILFLPIETKGRALD